VPLYTVDDLIKMVAVEGLTKAELKEKAVNQVGMSDSKFYDLYRELERVDGVTLSPRTKKLSYTNPSSAAKLN
jgi:ACT domain-containing protein